MDITLTFGVMPTFEVFEKQFEKHVPETRYYVEGNGLIEDGSYDCDELWKIVNELAEDKDTPLEWSTKLELVSCIFETLSIEWI